MNFSSNPVFLFSSFRGNGEDGLHLAYSRDGLKWTPLREDQSFLKPGVGGGLMRDPCIYQGPDGVFHMVWTTDWHDRGIGLAHSRDLITWSEQQFLPVMEHEPLTRNCWAPELFWDPVGETYLIFWASTIEEVGVKKEDSAGHRIYAVRTRDFRSFTPAELFF